ncbi:hypothetical protein CW304_32265 [Bacillus sp. UFRGS-B20]|nr:hypothetical protein CW304_32265 [Bacillus sp. UFRGS-B20]
MFFCYIDRISHSTSALLHTNTNPAAYFPFQMLPLDLVPCIPYVLPAVFMYIISPAILFLADYSDAPTCNIPLYRKDVFLSFFYITTVNLPVRRRLCISTGCNWDDLSNSLPFT